LGFVYKLILLSKETLDHFNSSAAATTDAKDVKLAR
jgi:hypothetical protein